MTNFILDTNIYRTLAHGKDIEQLKSELESIKAIKSEKNFKSIFPNIVAIELINHLLESNGATEDCFKGLYYLIYDARENNTESFQGRVVPTIHDLMTFYLFKKKSEHYKLNDSICHIAHRIAQDGDLAIIADFETEILQVIEFKKQELEGIIKNIENHYLKSINLNGITDWNIFENNKKLKNEFEKLIKNKTFHKIFGFSLIQMAVDETEQENVEFKLSDLENGLFKDFEMSIDFFVEQIWKKLIVIKKKEYLFNPESDPKKRWNSFYDLQLIFASEYENSFGRKTILVSQESRIRALFKKYGKSELVTDLDGYNSLLKN